MLTGLPAPTVAEQARFDWIHQIGCILCLLRDNAGTPCEIHHLTEAGRRISHTHTIGLCAHHHRGLDGVLSIDSGRKAFVQEYGFTEAKLLELQNYAIDLAKEQASIIPGVSNTAHRADEKSGGYD